MRLGVHVMAGAGICLSSGVAYAEPAPTPAVVRLWCKGEQAAGFVFRDRRHVLTAFEAVHSGRAVRVVFHDGRAIDGETVAVDRGAGLALVLLEADAPVEPLSLGGPVTVGLAVHALVPDPPEYEDKERLPAARVPGTIAAAGADRLQVAVSVPAEAAGAPLVDAEGRVVGLVRRGGLMVAAAPAHTFAALGGSAEKEDGYGGEGVFQLRGGWLMRAGEGSISHGPRLSIDLIARDRLYLTTRVSLLLGEPDGGVPGDLVGARSTGSLFDAELGWRFALPPEIPLQIAVGAGATTVLWSTEGHRIGENGQATRVQVDEEFLYPTARVGLGLNDLFEIDYTFELDVDDPGNSMHRIGFSIGF